MVFETLAEQKLPSHALFSFVSLISTSATNNNSSKFSLE